jgi:protein SCO1
VKSKIHYSWLLLLIPVVFTIWFLLDKSEDRPIRVLPIYGPKYSEKGNDTNYHRTSGFSFTNQYGRTTDSNSVRDKIYIAEFFFTTCKSICPIMNNNLVRVYKEFSTRSDFLILSHTVDPEQDSVSVLMDYANRMGVKNDHWLFLTGNKKELYEQARKSYLLNADSGDGGTEDFIHTQNFALIDKSRHIRGFYDGTDSLEVNRLITEIKLLYKEYDYAEKTAH